MVEAAQTGLTTTEVEQRIAAGDVNVAVEPPRRSLKRIFATNAFTPVNAVMLVLFALIIVSGNPRDGLFVGVVVTNTIVGFTQEVRARRSLERLQVLTEPRVTVVRDGEQVDIDRDDVVRDDIVVLSPGGQVPVDGDVLEAQGLRLDESMLTGESVAVPREPGAEVLSGSLVVAGSGRIRATVVGEGSYAASLAAEAKTFSAAESVLRQS
ncbi:MAG: cation-translocating P-type ATPase, partial [Actinomycetota bacterium]